MFEIVHSDIGILHNLSAGRILDRFWKRAQIEIHLCLQGFFECFLTPVIRYRSAPYISFHLLWGWAIILVNDHDTVILQKTTQKSDQMWKSPVVISSYFYVQTQLKPHTNNYQQGRTIPKSTSKTLKTSWLRSSTGHIFVEIE